MLQIRAGPWSITANLWPLTAHIYHVMIILTGEFSKKSFLLLLFLFCRNSFERSWTCFFGTVKHLKQLSILCLRVEFKVMTDFFLMKESFYFIWQLQGIDIRLCYL